MGKSCAEDALATAGNAHPPLLELRGGVLSLIADLRVHTDRLTELGRGLKEEMC